MAVKGFPLTVTASAAVVVSSATGDRNGHTVLVQNPAGASTVYLGGSNVASTTYGYALAAGNSLSVDLEEGETLYAIMADGNQNVNVLLSGDAP